MQNEVELRPVDAAGDTYALTSSKFKTLVCIALIVLTLGVYLQVGSHGFSNYDDNDYVTDNPHVTSGLTPQNIAWAFTSVEAANWHPITWISHMADVQFLGMNPGAHHVVNVAIHIISTLLLFLFLSRITSSIWRSAFVAAMFALHPLHVESVAWVSERKDVLSAFFCFLTLWLYARYVKEKKDGLYYLTLLSFVLGLMSKPMLVTLPGVMLLMDLWPLNRCEEISAWIKEKIPFFACSLFSAAMTIYAQKQGGALRSIHGSSLWFRLQHAAVAYVKYLAKAVWPTDLAIVYPLPSSIPLWQVAGSLVLLLSISAAAVALWRRHTYLAVGWFWFLITLVPVIGIVQVGSQSIADRYSYIPFIGLFIIAAWGVPALLNELPNRQTVLSVVAGVVILAAAGLSWKQVGYWRDDASLFGHAAQVTEGNHVAHSYLGLDRAKKGDLDGAIREFQVSVSIYPKDFEVRNCLGICYANKGAFDDAIKQYEVALSLNPNYADAYQNMQVALQKRGAIN